MLRHLIALTCLLIAATGPAACAARDPYFVDLSEAATTGLEDDGIRDNGAGGWTDEGINDMYLWPPVPLGEDLYGGCPFRVIDPAENDGRAVVMLKGQRRARDKPVQAEAKVKHVSGRYLYFMHHSAASVNRPDGYVAATYTVCYADGTEEQIPMREGIELHNWWTGRRSRDEATPQRWPVHYGRNLYTDKWGSRIGVWATRWENPHPNTPIVSVRFRSREYAVPVIFAVTISDTDYYAQREPPPEIPPVPEGYFDAKADQENKALYPAMIEAGLVEGIRDVQVVRGDLLAVTVDAGLTRSGHKDIHAGRYQRPGAFLVSSPTDAAYEGGAQPARVGRFSWERWNGAVGPYPANIIYWHTYYLRLPEALEAGNDYTVTVPGMDGRFPKTRVLAYDDRATVTPVIKINQVAYCPAAERRYAYLGWWAGDMGPVDYSGLDEFRVVDEQSGETVLEGNVELRRADDELSGEDVYQMDISALGPGRYHIHVPGLARSNSFSVGGSGMRDLYYHTMRAFFHQRCGQELREPWTWVHRDACHLWCWESGYLVGNRSYSPKPGEEKRRFVGGYHDAADFDCFTYHLRATAQAMSAYERAPEAFADGDLDLPESGNGIPDVLDEARWGLSFYHDNQREDGGVPLGRGNDCDAFAQQTGGRRPPFGVLPVRPDSCTEYAATAAQFARLMRPHDAALAADYLRSAVKAYRWAAGKLGPSEEGDLRAWAAAELYRTTGNESYNEDFLRLFHDGALRIPHPVHSQHAGLFLMPYLLCERPGTDPEVQSELRRRLLDKADALCERAGEVAYRMSHGGRDAFLGAGTGNGGGYYADALLRSYWLTGEQEYLDYACLNADFQLGCNPLSKVFITGMGYRNPARPEISGFLYEGPGFSGRTVEGITVYGLAGKLTYDWHPRPVPEWRRWRDLWGAGSEISSEFTISQCIGPSAMLHAALYVLDRQPAPGGRHTTGSQVRRRP